MTNKVKSTTNSTESEGGVSCFYFLRNQTISSEEMERARNGFDQFKHDIKLVLRFVFHTEERVPLEQEKEIAKECKLSYKYAKYIKSRFELGEKTISKNSYYSYVYARDIIKGRFELGENAIIKSAEAAYNYAHDVLKGRFELGENKISSSHHAFNYAFFVTKEKFTLGEPKISKCFVGSYEYSLLINDRFELGEKSIFLNARNEYTIDYLNRFVRQRIPIIETNILNVKYKKNISTALIKTYIKSALKFNHE